jgi:hypothetical protein
MTFSAWILVALLVALLATEVNEWNRRVGDGSRWRWKDRPVNEFHPSEQAGSGSGVTPSWRMRDGRGGTNPQPAIRILRRSWIVDLGVETAGAFAGAGLLGRLQYVLTMSGL